MHISLRSDYAIRALAELVNSPHSPVTASALAQRQQLPTAYLQHILTDLRRLGVLRASSGTSGGYRLRQPATTIRFADVIFAIEGPFTVGNEWPASECYEGASQNLGHLWKQIERDVVAVLQSHTLDELVADPVDDGRPDR